MDWSVDNMPEIIYTFKKPPQPPPDPTLPRGARIRSRKPDMKTYPIHGEYLRDIEVLPDYISSNVEEFRVEAWTRLDSRIRLDDITSRMHPRFRISESALTGRGKKFRKAFHLLSWRNRGGKAAEQGEALEENIRREMVNRGIDPSRNSTRGLTPGLINPDLGEDGGRIPVPEPFRRPAADQSSFIASLNPDDYPSAPAGPGGGPAFPQAS